MKSWEKEWETKSGIETERETDKVWHEMAFSIYIDYSCMLNSFSSSRYITVFTVCVYACVLNNLFWGYK